MLLQSISLAQVSGVDKRVFSDKVPAWIGSTLKCRLLKLLVITTVLAYHMEFRESTVGLVRALEGKQFVVEIYLSN